MLNPTAATCCKETMTKVHAHEHTPEWILAIQNTKRVDFRRPLDAQKGERIPLVTKTHASLDHCTRTIKDSLIIPSQILLSSWVQLESGYLERTRASH